MYKTLVYVTATVHWLLIATMFMSAVILPFAQPWYIAIPLVICIIRVGTSRDKCIITDFENKLRRKAGMPVMLKGFIYHYMLKLRRHYNG